MHYKVKIYQPAKNAMQSGRRNSQYWFIETDSTSKKIIEPLMGWTSSTDTRSQIRLRFKTKEDAIAYAERNDLDYHLIEPKERILRPKNYADNFSQS